MPRVPVYDSPTVTPQPLPGVQMSDSSHLMQWAGIGAREEAQTGAALSQVGNKLGEIAADKQATINEATVKQAYNQLATTGEDVLKNPETGFLNQSGETAFKTVQDVKDGLAKSAQTIGESLGNKPQKDLFQQHAADLLLQYNSLADQHAAGQLKQWNVDQNGASAQTQARQAIAFKDDDKLRTQAFDLGTDYIKELYKDKPKDFVDNKVLDYTTGVTSEIVKNYITEGRAGAAKAFFENHINLVSEDKRDDIRAVIKQSSDIDDEATAYRSLQTSSGGYQSQLKTLQDAFDNNGSIGGVQIDGKKFFQLKQLLDHDKSQAQENDGKYVASVLGKAQTWALDPNNAGKTILDWKVEHPLEYSAIESKGHVNTLNAYITNGGVTSPSAMTDFNTHWGDGSDRDYSAMTPAQLALKRVDFSGEDWKHVESTVMGNLKKLKDPDTIGMGMFTPMFNSALQQIDIDPKKISTGSNEDSKTWLASAQEMAKNWILQDQSEAGHRLSQKDMQSSINRLFATNVEFRNTFAGITYGGTQSEPMMKMTYNDLPGNAVEGIKKDLVSAGNPNPTKADILKQYWMMHRGR